MISTYTAVMYAMNQRQLVVVFFQGIDMTELSRDQCCVRSANQCHILVIRAMFYFLSGDACKFSC